MCARGDLRIVGSPGEIVRRFMPHTAIAVDEDGHFHPKRSWTCSVNGRSLHAFLVVPSVIKWPTERTRSAASIAFSFFSLSMHL